MLDGIKMQLSTKVFEVMHQCIILFVWPLADRHLQSIKDGNVASVDLETSLRSVTVSRNYILSLLVISACCKLIKYVSKMPNDYSLYMRAILSVFGGVYISLLFVSAISHSRLVPADKTVGIFVGMFLFVITAFGLASEVAFYDRDSKLQTARSSWMNSFQGVNGMGSTTDYVFATHAIEPNSYGYAGFYFCVTTLIGNLILSNLVVNVLGERYALACEELIKDKRKLQIENFIKHGRHVLLRKLYFRSDHPYPIATKWKRFLSWFPKPFLPWLANE